MKRLFLFAILVLILATSGFAQWTPDPNLNTVIVDTTGEQDLPKTVACPDGSTYISWFDNRGGSYAVYMQRLNADGVKLWGSQGLLISNNPQSSSLVDYDITCDASNNAIVAFTDTRSGDLDVFAYKISPSGQFLWGANGVTLSSGTGYEANPTVAVTTDGNVVVAWIYAVNPYKIYLQKIDPTGAKLWGATAISYGSTTEGYNNPIVVPSDNGSVIVSHKVTIGNFPAQTVKLAAQKFNSAGAPQWGTGGVWVQNLGKVMAFTAQYAAPDGVNGVVIAWHDDRNSINLQSSWVQRVKSDGTLAFPANGAEVATTGNIHKFNPRAGKLTDSEEVMVFWRFTNSNQNQDGLAVQKFSATGVRQFTDDGIILRPMTGSANILGYDLATLASSSYIVYNVGDVSGLNNTIQGLMINSSGANVWGSTIALSSLVSNKSRLQIISDITGAGLAFWTDERVGDGVYGQKINTNGTLGNQIVPVELNNFGAAVNGNSVLLEWSTATETNNAGFSIERKSGDGSWVTIGEVAGAGTSTAVIHYSFADKSLGSGNYYYRLIQKDLDGTTKIYDLLNEVLIGVPEKFELNQNFPNPFNPTTSISFSLPVSGVVSLKVYNTMGEEVATLVNETREAGSYEIKFDATKITSGIYFYTLTSGEFKMTKKLVLMK
ncbi:MAG: T9SS type A sorting domain-containing protein [Ignavibacteriales bacterium]|nr:T9SS type A sorting domain-containing protein [Ignavibacteriales bacterium]